MRLELRGVHSGGGEYRHHHQAAIFQLQTGPIPQSTPDVFDGGLEEWRHKRIARCRRLTKHALTIDTPLGLMSSSIVTLSLKFSSCGTAANAAAGAAYRRQPGGQRPPQEI